MSLHHRLNECRENINLMLTILDKDKDFLKLYIAFCFAIPSITLTALISQNEAVKDLAIASKILFIVSLFLFLVAGGLFTYYAYKVHETTIKILQFMTDLDRPGRPTQEIVECLHKKIFKPNIRKREYFFLYWGWGTLFVALILYVFFVLDYIGILFA